MFEGEARLMTLPLKTLSLFVFFLIFSCPVAADSDTLRARVGEIEIREFDLNFEIQRKLPMQVGFHGKLSAEKLAAIKQDALEDLIEQAYRANWARDNQISVDAADLDEAMKPLRKRYSSDEEMMEAVGEKTYHDIRSLVYRGLLAQKAQQQWLAGKAEISDEQVRSYYEKNKDRFFRPRQFRASHILVKVDPSSNKAERKALHVKAQGLLERARAGEDFYDLAYFNSDDRHRYVGGDLGTFHVGQTVPAFEEALIAMEPGEISELVKTRFGYHIIKLAEVNEARQLSFDEMKDKIRDDLAQQEREALLDAWLKELKDAYPLHQQALQ